MTRKDRRWVGWSPSQRMDPNSPQHAGRDGIPVMPGLPGSARHNIVCIEADCPGVFEITCSCGEQAWTPWGAAHAEEVAKVHLWAVGAPIQRVIR